MIAIFEVLLLDPVTLPTIKGQVILLLCAGQATLYCTTGFYATGNFMLLRESSSI